ncbi:MAG: AAA family ATPase [Candidatus Aminicenantes bacterium]|nr:AAA family ATPase [Candidatus Aminicenantes bacterium]NIM84324.1 AAA family ATPase [Candidatus Aminicenantes bacterium]NIN23810.1 AAA family ATPase [Candidatus Aminicenantes bacterium]NIN47526.1 AAA family ATPase [Candidatus Aminicenantes bacterium]NIN90446.1 AAA family ATPase [Candidatus Aminicenantes bacterium]
MKTKRLPVGVSDFKDMVTGNYCYVDKTLFIKEIIDKGDKILLVPRPRRFGKTLNLSMLKYFYDCCPVMPSPALEPCSPANETNIAGLAGHSYKKLFDSLAILEAGREYLDKLGKHPVIFISFRSIKELDWESCLSKTKQLIQDEYLKHDYLLNSPGMKYPEKDYYKRIIDLKGNKGDYENSLEKLLIFLSRFYHERAVILIDEYDAPVHAGFTYGYYEEIINFMRNFLCGGLKDTDQYLEKSVVTGIMRIAKESIFSGLNNLGVYTLVSEEFNDQFGFTEKEVEALLTDFDLLDRYDEVQYWYNGYRFGSRIVYNPWSIVNFLGSKAKELKPYWVNTSNNQVVETLLSRGGKELKEELELLIRGETLEKAVEENIVLIDITAHEDLLWSFLLMGGYLKQTAKRMDETAGKMYYTLAIPNMEVRTIYIGIINRYFTGKIENKKLEIMLKALIDGDIKLFEKMLRKIVAAVFSYHDFSGEPEKVYHALVAGLLVWISNTHEIKSNRESGYGRYDIMIIPRDITGLGYVIEFKAVDKDENETVPSAVAAALEQIEEKKYETELMERGIENIKKLAVVFSGKDVYVKENNSGTEL